MEVQKGLFLADIISLMMEYQRDNKIKNECITNVQVMYDVFKATGINVKAKAVIVVADNRDGSEGLTTVAGHLVLVDPDSDFMLECSYDISTLEGLRYCHDSKEYLNILPSFVNNTYKRDTVQMHLDFITYANQINSGKFIVSDKYYDSLLAFLESRNSIIKNSIRY